MRAYRPSSKMTFRYCITQVHLRHREANATDNFQLMAASFTYSCHNWKKVVLLVTHSPTWLQLAEFAAFVL